MWSVKRAGLRDREKVSVLSGGTPLSFPAVLDAWRSDAAFRTFFLTELAAAPFAAFFWEMPPVKAGDLGLAFEYVTVDNPALRSIRADPTAFSAPLARAPADQSVAAFPSLGASATLVVPRSAGGLASYGHIAAFARAAPEAQKHDLLALTAEVALGALSARPLWISTSGLGVHWLHVRLEGRPVYYSHAPYRDPELQRD